MDRIQGRTSGSRILCPSYSRQRHRLSGDLRGTLDRELLHWRFFHVGACRNRALAPVKYFRGHRTLQQLIERV